MSTPRHPVYPVHPLVEQAAALAKRVVEENYFQIEYAQSLKDMGMAHSGLIQHCYPASEVVKWADHYHCLLPESPIIRHGAFWALCDLAEHIFDDDMEPNYQGFKNEQ
jgi:hypothetical protein